MLPFDFCSACYAVAFWLEFLRLCARKRKEFYTHNIGLFPAAVGFILHTLFIYQQHVIATQPLNGATMFFLVSSWGLVLIYIIWAYRYPNIPFGIILLPLIGLLSAIGYRSASVIAITESSSRSLIKMLHAAPAVGTMVALSIACTCCVFYLLESNLLRKKYPLTPLLKLPSLEWSLSVFRISCTIAIGCLCLCAFGGALLTFHRNTAAVWQDPIRVGTLCLLVILLFGSLKWLFHSPRTTENRFVFMLVVFVFITFLSILIGVLLSNHDAHWNKPPPVMAQERG
jgi:hypothetical protein